MEAPASLSSLVRDLRSFDTPTARFESSVGVQACRILETFIRHSSARAGAFYRISDLGLQLTASSGVNPPALVSTALPQAPLRRGEGVEDHPLFALLPPELDVFVPLGHGNDRLGLIALGSVDMDNELLDAAASYLGAVLRSQRMGGEVREGELQLKYRLLELESLYDIGLSIASTLNLEDLADEILARTISLLDARSAALFLRKGDRFELYSAFGSVRGALLESEIEADLTRELIEDGKPLKIDSGADCVFPGCESFLAIPIKSNKGVVGVLAAADREQRDGGIGHFGDGDLRLLSQFATQAAIALDNARLHREALEKQVMERELELAAMIQRDILPREVPVVEGLELATIAIPAKQLGGDYHTFFDPGDGSLGICLADVSGKSVPAAILVSALHAAIQLLVREDRDLGEIATELNSHIHRWSAENKFATLVIATVDREGEMIRYVNAGHNPAWVIHEGRSVALNSNGLPIGLLSQSRYSVQRAVFKPGSLLAVYSDGISEAENEADEEFGEDRLEQLLTAGAGMPLRELAALVERSVEEFAGSVPQKDDQTLVLVRSAL